MSDNSNPGVTKQAFMKYVNAAHDLAEAIKKNIQKNNLITQETVLALNEFTISANEIIDFLDDIESTNETDESLN